MFLLNHSCLCFLYLKYFRIVCEYLCLMNIKTNTLFFVKNTISKVNTTNQDYHYNEQHHEKPNQLYIQTKDYSFLVQEKAN